MRKIMTAVSAALAAVALAHAPIAGAVPAMPQGYPIENLDTECRADVTPEWRYGCLLYTSDAADE